MRVYVGFIFVALVIIIAIALPSLTNQKPRADTFYKYHLDVPMQIEQPSWTHEGGMIKSGWRYEDGEFKSDAVPERWPALTARAMLNGGQVRKEALDSYVKYYRKGFDSRKKMASLAGVDINFLPHPDDPRIKLVQNKEP